VPVRCPMSRRLNVVCVLAGSVLVPVGGCGHESGAEGPTAAARAEVTLHVPDMVERQGLT
jgi:hypothetical protein